jgi:hypothetical protein
VTGNSAEDGGGFYDASSSALALTITNSAFSANSALYDPNIDGPATNGGGNTFS